MKDSLAPWRLAGLIATAAIVLSFPAARWRESQLRQAAASVEETPAAYVGREKCIECHKGAYEKWAGSDHDLAMDVATDETVLGNFDGAVLRMDGYETRYFRRDGKFLVHTEGPDGAMADFEVTHVFGVRPLQQYLIPFPGGRYQVLGSAWDTVKKRVVRHVPRRGHPPRRLAPLDAPGPELELHVRRLPLHEPAQGLRHGERTPTTPPGPRST